MEGEWRGEGSHESGAGGDAGGQERHHALLMIHFARDDVQKCAVSALWLSAG